MLNNKIINSQETRTPIRPITIVLNPPIKPEKKPPK